MTEDVIDEVFYAIEKKPRWRNIYDDNVLELEKTVTNTWCGHWIASAVGKNGIVLVPSKRNSLTLTYSLLDRPEEPRKKKLKPADAAKLMSDLKDPR